MPMECRSDAATLRPVTDRSASGRLRAPTISIPLLFNPRPRIRPPSKEDVRNGETERDRETFWREREGGGIWMEERETAGGTSGGSRPVSGREDCWSEGATVALIQAWGDRHLELNRGNLKQKHWQEVADAVNGRPGAARARKTDVQCKNRIDTLKKKYKAEKARVLATNGAFVSKWPYYDRIDDLIVPAATTKKALPVTPAVKGEPPMALPLYRTTAVPVVAARAAAAAAGREKRPAEDDYVFRRIPTSDTQSGSSRSKTSPDSAESSRESKGKGGNGNGDGGGFRELARAIMRFGEIYEKVEAAKQRQMMDLERQRMEFVKGLEFQRMQIFMDSQVELAKMKKAKRANTAERCRPGVLPQEASSFVVHSMFGWRCKGSQVEVRGAKLSTCEREGRR